MTSVTFLSTVLLAAVLLASCDTGSKRTPEPTPSPAVEASATSAPLPDCPVPQQDVCDFAAKAEAWMRDRNFAELSRGSTLARDVMSARGFLDGGTPEVVSIGCPMAAVPLGCGATFALGFSTLQRGVDPGSGPEGIVVLTFLRDPDCSMAPIYETGVIPTCAPPEKVGPPLLTAATAPPGLEFRRVVLNGGIAQGRNLAGRPQGIGDSEVRSIWQTYAAHVLPPAQPEMVEGLPVRRLTLAQSRPMPVMGELIVASGCWGCEGFDSRLDRIAYVGGKLRRDVLLETSAGISGYAIRPDLSEIVVSVCVQGYCGPLNAVTPDARSELRRSRDGGVTWETIASFDGVAQAHGFVGDQVLLDRASGPGDPREWTYQPVTWPDMKAFTPPPGAADSRPSVQAGGAVTFASKDHLSLLNADGSTYWTFPLKLPAEWPALFTTPFPPRVAITWSTTPGQQTRSYLGIFDGGRLTAVFSGDPLVCPGAWFARNAFISSVQATPEELGLTVDPNMRSFQSPFPSVVNVDEGTIAPIEPQFFLDTYGPTNRKSVVAFLPGPFARVNTPGDCLNVRAEPSTSAQSLGCFKDGVLLHVTGGEAVSGGITWLPVTTPNGRAGWASGEFLER